MLSPALSSLLHPHAKALIQTSLHLYSCFLTGLPASFFTHSSPCSTPESCISKMQSNLLCLAFRLGFRISCLVQLTQPLFSGLSPILLLQETLTSSRHRFPSPLLFIHTCPAMDSSQPRGRLFWTQGAHWTWAWWESSMDEALSTRQWTRSVRRKSWNQ